MKSRTGRLLVLVVAVFAGLSACGSEDEGGVRSYLEGHVTVRAAIDSTRDYRGFEVLIASADGEADTLGFAVTDSTGFFAMDIRAADRGIYPVIVGRRGAVLKRGQLVVADRDSAIVQLRLPDGNRPLVIRSRENAAWLAYRNSKMVHNRQLLSLIQSGGYTAESQSSAFSQTSAVLWSLHNQFPGTIGAEVASVESILLIEGIEDSLVVERSRLISTDNPGFTDVARAARRAGSRLFGQDSSLAIVREMLSRTEDRDARAALVSEIVVAHVDSNRLDAAVSEANRIIADYADTRWADWAKDAVYEIEHLMPGMEAPAFEAETWAGSTYRFDPAAPGVVLLEFFRPTNETYLRERPLRDSLAAAVSGNASFVSISFEADDDLNEAFFESHPGDVDIALPMGEDDPLARSFNVKTLPKRFLIKDGVIVGKYTGPAMQSVAHDLLAVAAAPPS